MPTTSTWSQMTDMQKHRMINDNPAEAQRLRAQHKLASEAAELGITHGEVALSKLAAQRIEGLGTMGLHRMLNDDPHAALRLFESAAKADPEKYSRRVASLRSRLNVA